MLCTLLLRARPTMAALALTAASALAPAAAAPRAETSRVSDRSLPRMDRPVTLALARLTLREAVRALASAAEVRFQPLWSDDLHAEGLQADTLVDLEAQGTTLAAAIESILAQCDPELGGGSTWQITESGIIQIGPRSRLNAYRSIRMYQVRDLLTRIPDFRETATIDLEAALQGRAGGGVLRGDGPRTDPPAAPQEPVTQLIDLIIATVEPAQWELNGGTGATIREFQGQLVILAPGYLHRQIAPR